MGKEPYDIAKIIAKYLQNELSGEEESMFKAWLQRDDANRQLLESFRDASQVQPGIDFFACLDVEEAWLKVGKKRRDRQIKKILRWMTGIAAAVILLLVGMWWWNGPFPVSHTKPRKIAGVSYRNDVEPGQTKARLLLSDGGSLDLSGKGRSRKKVAEKDGTEIAVENGEVNYVNKRIDKSNISLLYNILQVPKAGTFRIVLPDGTKVLVNSLSSLKFPVQFGNGQRKVYLDGEAYFDVHSDPLHPFLVETRNSTVEVLGTQFNVKNYGDKMTTTLVEGSVNVGHNGTKKLLIPGQKAQLCDQRIVVRNADLEQALAWKHGDFYFKSNTMSEIADELSRWYDLEVSYQGKVTAKRYSGSIRRSARLTEVLELLNYASGAQFEINEHQLTIKLKNAE